jgi:hypothetical protein
MSDRERPASATARRQESMVSLSALWGEGRPTADCPAPVMHTRFSGYALSGISFARRLEHREVDLAMLLEDDLDTHADAHFLYGTSYDVREHIEFRLLDEFYRREDVGNLEAGHPLLIVHSEGRDAGTPRYRSGAHCVAAARRTARKRRMQIAAASLAAADQEPTLGACRPEELRSRFQCR